MRPSARELEAAISVWKRYLDSKPEIDEIFDKFDVNKSGKLEADQLKAFLTELNDGIQSPPVKRFLKPGVGSVAHFGLAPSMWHSTQGLQHQRTPPES